MTESSPDLDVVVLGGGGHVGLPLSLASPRPGLRVGIYDTNQATLDRIAAGEMPFMENGADELLREVLPTGRLSSAPTRSMIEPDRPPRGRHRHAGRRVPRAVDDDLREGGRPDRAAPPRRRARRPAQHRLSRARPATSPSTSPSAAARVDVAFCPERIAEGHALEELHTLPQIIGADDDAAAERATALFGTLASKTIRTTTKEAELAKLFTNTWRYMKFAVANQFFMIAHQRRASTTRTSCARSARTTRARPTCRARASPPDRACSRTRCSSSAFTADHFPLGQAAMQVNEGLPAYIVSALERRYGGLQGKTVGHPRDGLQGRVRRPAGVAQLQAAQAAVVGRRARARAPIRTSRTTGS